MKIVINVANLIGGGALQVALGFASEVLAIGGDKEWVFLISNKVKSEFEFAGIETSGMIVFDASPAHSGIVRKQISKFLDKINPDVVLTLFGPAYIKIPFVHIMGVGDGWVTHSDYQAFKSLKGFPVAWIRVLFKILFKVYWYRFADRWIVEAPCAKTGLIKRIHAQDEAVSVIPNTCQQIYRASDHSQKIPAVGTTVNILVFAGPYPHKNLTLLPLLVRSLKNKTRNYDFRIVVTLPKGKILSELKNKAVLLGVEGMIVNKGVVNVVDGPSLYKECHISFLPTSLETFSAVYPESMAMGLPIITSDLQFAKDICGDAARYFKARNMTDASDKILELLENEALWKELILRGKRRLESMPDSEQRFKMYLNVINESVTADTL